MPPDPMTCATCGATCVPSGCTMGYGTDPTTGKKHCFACCGKREEAAMIATGCAVLYLESEPIPDRPGSTRHRVTNWPGTLSIPCQVRRGRHNIARVRYDVWFKGPDGKPWHGVQYGDNTQICRCKRIAAA